jgi:predicted ATPase/DNA-binding winged helix-turn-helix (wHTH) protein
LSDHSSQSLFFGAFELRPADRVLLESGIPVSLGARALDILIVLAENAGTVVSNDEIFNRVWPSLNVGEGSLRVHLVAVRKALREGEREVRFISNIPGRGYSFVGSVVRGSSPSFVPATLAKSLPSVNTRVFGRSSAIDDLIGKLPERRFITIVGPGGVGKTTAAVSVASQIASRFRDNVVFVDVSTVANSALVASALASALGVATREENALPDIIHHLRAKQLLLVLDSCETAIDAAAALAEAIVEQTSGIEIIATSREPLSAKGEWIHRLPPLECPPAQVVLSLADLLTFPAIQLFIERASAVLDSFELTNSNALLVSEICRKLDGVPLAIELVASRVDTVGIYGLPDFLNDRSRLLNSVSRRTAHGRHRTLQSTLDWSFALLSNEERAAMRRLAVFAGAFDLDAAVSIASDAAGNRNSFIELIHNLVLKSLITIDLTGCDVSYRLLDTTRLYALEKLAESQETISICKRHADYFKDVLNVAASETEAMSTADWLRAHGRHLANVRAAIEWAFSAEGDLGLVLDLTIGAVPLWTRLLLLRECVDGIERALKIPELLRDRHHNMMLYAGLGSVAGHADLTSPEMKEPWWKVLALAEELNAFDHQTRALWGLWVQSCNDGKFRAALELAKRFTNVAQKSSDPAVALIGDRIVGYTLHFLGDQTGAKTLIDKMLDRYPMDERRAHTFRFQFDQPVTAKITLAWIYWIQGFPDQAIHCTKLNIQDAIAIDHPLSLGNALAKSACSIALLTGDMTLAERLVELFVEETAPDSLAIWRALSQCFEGLLQLKKSELSTGLNTLQAALAKFPGGRFTFPYTWVLGELALAQVRCGEFGASRLTIDQAITSAEADEEGWCLPELYRLKGECLLIEAGPNSFEAAKRFFLRSLDVAHQQKALSWELRAAISLAHFEKLSGEQGHLARLAVVYEQFTEGFHTADLCRARELLIECGWGS